jgi:hypothetical protein
MARRLTTIGTIGIKRLQVRSLPWSKVHSFASLAAGPYARSELNFFSEDGSAAYDLTRWLAANTYLKSRPPIIDESNLGRDFREHFSGIQTFVAG